MNKWSDYKPIGNGQWRGKNTITFSITCEIRELTWKAVVDNYQIHTHCCWRGNHQHFNALGEWWMISEKWSAVVNSNGRIGGQRWNAHALFCQQTRGGRTKRRNNLLDSSLVAGWTYHFFNFIFCNKVKFRASLKIIIWIEKQNV